jgi:hypothetical protein
MSSKKRDQFQKLFYNIMFTDGQADISIHMWIPIAAEESGTM